MEASQNMIHRASFNFEYRSAASAVRSNILIETIFDSHILPQLDLAISSQIPDGLFIELSKLEINIGKISEKDLTNNLAGKIKTALEDAIKSKTRTGNRTLSENAVFARPDSGNVLLKSIAIYLQRGYFLFGMGHSASIDELVAQAIARRKKEFIEIVYEHRRQEEVLKRIVHNLNPETFDLLLLALNPLSGKWIIEFRQILSSSLKETYLKQQNDHEFIRTLNYFSLNFILNEIRSGFDKSKFIAVVLDELRSIYKTDLQLLLQAIKKSPSPVSLQILNQAEKQISGQQPVLKSLNIDQLLILLNTANIRNNIVSYEFLRAEIIRSSRNEESRKQLIKKLNQSGIRTILSLFSQKSADEIFKLINAIHQSNEAVLFNEIALNAVDYFSQNTIRSFSPEELTLFLIYSAGPDISRIISSASFRSFVQARKKLDMKKIQELIDDETRNPEIIAIQKILLKDRHPKPGKDGNLPVVPNPEDYFIIPKRKIIGYFLNTDRLPDAYSGLSQTDVQTIFDELILLKDDFLAKQLLQVKHPESLIQSLKALTYNLPVEELEAYFIHYFRNEFDILSELINQTKFLFRTGTEIVSGSRYRIDLLLSSLAKSKGGSLSEVFLFSLINGLNAAIEIDSQLFLQHLFSDFDIPELAALLNQKNSGMELKRMFERNFRQFSNKIHLSGIEINPPDKNLEELTKSIAFFFEVDQEYFLDHLQQNTTELPRIYAALKSNLNQEWWNKIEKGMFSRPELKSEIEQQTKDKRIPQNLYEGSQLTRNWINQLLAHPPQVKSAKIDRNFWRSVVSGFKLLSFPETAEISLNALSGSFLNYLLQKLKIINEAEQFYPILEQLKSSGSKELIALADYWQDVKILISTTSGDEAEEKNGSRNASYYLSVLRFYAINGVFPWWAGKLTFPELLSGLAKNSTQHPDQFEDSVLRLEKEETILEMLISKTSEADVKEFGHLFSNHTKLITVWKQILQNRKSGIQEKPDEKLLLLKEIYHSNDEQSFSKWLGGHPEIAHQIKEYLLLAPFFYFRNMNPAQWRKAVYQFSLDYYGLTPKRINHRFPTDFLSYLKRKHSNVDWDECLSTVYQLVNSPKVKVKGVFPEALLPLIPFQAKIKTEDKKDANLIPVQDGEEVKIYNSGLILFWPFLTRLFENLSLVKNGEFVDAESKNRAVYILQYLVYNEIDFPEHLLVLNKLLAGFQPEEHLVPIESLKKEEITSAQSLLNGLISNWEKVKNSSPEGIQETFIQREGILRFQSNKISLVVEKKGFDVLLQSLPWNISLVKLSWMKMPIYVEWT